MVRTMIIAANYSMGDVELKFRIWFKIGQTAFTVLVMLGDHKGRPYRRRIAGRLLWSPKKCKDHFVENELCPVK